jgi:hypothetical protein
MTAFHRALGHKNLPDGSNPLAVTGSGEYPLSRADPAFDAKVLLALGSQVGRCHPMLAQQSAALPGQGESSREPPVPPGLHDDNGSGDILYGARAIALWWWNDPSDKARKRVFTIWSVVKNRPEKMGLFKMKDTSLCLSKSAFLAWLPKKLNNGK